ncbi:hypothetical protein ANAPC5_01302 [Anaplasma phagocytophilum]|nr:hypothetical protein ANAPC5_01302 [Anaplasma phagocytophilum]
MKRVHDYIFIFEGRAAPRTDRDLALARSRGRRDRGRWIMECCQSQPHKWGTVRLSPVVPAAFESRAKMWFRFTVNFADFGAHRFKKRKRGAQRAKTTP